MIVDDIALTLHPNIGPKTAAYLLSCFPSSESIFNASLEELVRRAALNPEIAQRLLKKEYHRHAEGELKYCEKHGITPIVSTDPRYPAMLLECGDNPHVIYYIGNTEALGARMISVVGTRRMTSYGQKVCTRLISELAQLFPDLVVVSGLAFGVDATAHRVAMAAGVRTIAVLPGQLPEVYPAAHASLAEEIVKSGGGLLTEYNSANKNKGVNFVPRNRIIAGMSAGTLVVESPVRGGALITAGMADGYNRGVMAVPGRVGDTCSEGTNSLIANNKAVMVCSGADIARELGWDIPCESVRREYDDSTLGHAARKLLGHINSGEQVAIDTLAAKAGLSIAEMAPLLFELEFDGAIRMLPGKLYERA